MACFPSSWLCSVGTSPRASIFNVPPMIYIITFLKPKVQQFQVPVPLRIHSVIFIFVYVTLYSFEGCYLTPKSAMLDHNPVLWAPTVTHEKYNKRKVAYLSSISSLNLQMLSNADWKSLPNPFSLPSTSWSGFFWSPLDLESSRLYSENGELRMIWRG